MHEELSFKGNKKDKILKFKHVLILGNELKMNKRKSKTVYSFDTWDFSYMGVRLKRI